MNMKYILCALGGAAVGFGGATLWYRKKMQRVEGHLDILSEKVHENVEKVQDLMNNVHSVMRDKEADGYLTVDAEGELEAVAEKIADATMSVIDELREEYFAKTKEEPEKPVTLAPEEKSFDHLACYAITVGDFMDDVRYDKVYCEYYRRTDSLVDVKTQTEMDAYEAFGDMCELLSGWVGSEIYIRNTKTNTDYEIDFLPGSFGGGDT